MTNDSNEQYLAPKAIEEILHRVDLLPVVDSRTADEILGYDEHGLPEPAASQLADKQMRPLPNP